MNDTTHAQTNNRWSTQTMVLVGLMTAITCILAPLSIPIPMSPVPITLTNLVLYLSLFLLGWKKATISYIVYLLLGIVGLPVFSGFSGGIGKLAGPTGGYLIGFLFLTIIAGFIMEQGKGNKIIAAIGLLLGTAICYLFGTFWLSHQLSLTFSAGLAAGVIPYIPGDAIKIIIALLLGPAIKKRLTPIM